MKLSKEQEDARFTMYEEAAQHLEMSVCETAFEVEAAKIVAKQIRGLARRFEASRLTIDVNTLPENPYAK